MSERRKPGPQHKGERRPVYVRIPKDQHAVYEALADEAGLSLSDYVVALLAKSHGLPVPAYIAPADPNGPRQEELRISA